MLELVPPPLTGRIFSDRRRIALADTDPEGRLRPDALARYLQDVATDDWDDTGVSTGEVWVIRRTSFQLVPGASWPTFGSWVELATWCSGIGAAVAGRRTDLSVEGTVVVQAKALWVPLDRMGRPQRIREGFRAPYEGAAGGRRVSGRVTKPSVAEAAEMRSWPLRRVDLDVAGHVNNAASWAALVEAAPGPLSSASLTHHGPIEWGDSVTLATAPNLIWLLVADTVQISGEYEVAGARERSD